MGGGHGRHPVRVAAAHGHRRQQQALGHGGAGPVKPQMGDPGVAQGKAGADALVQQVPGEDQVQIPLLQLRLVQQLFQGQLLHFLFGLLPGLFSEFCVHALDVEAVAQGAFGFLFPGNAGPGGNIHRLPRPEAVAA